MASCKTTPSIERDLSMYMATPSSDYRAVVESTFLEMSVQLKSMPFQLWRSGAHWRALKKIRTFA